MATKRFIHASHDLSEDYKNIQVMLDPDDFRVTDSAKWGFTIHGEGTFKRARQQVPGKLHAAIGIFTTSKGEFYVFSDRSMVRK